MKIFLKIIGMIDLVVAGMAGGQLLEITKVYDKLFWLNIVRLVLFIFIGAILASGAPLTKTINKQ